MAPIILTLLRCRCPSCPNSGAWYIGLRGELVWACSQEHARELVALRQPRLPSTPRQRARG